MPLVIIIVVAFIEPYLWTRGFDPTVYKDQHTVEASSNESPNTVSPRETSPRPLTTIITIPAKASSNPDTPRLVKYSCPRMRPRIAVNSGVVARISAALPARVWAIPVMKSDW